MKILTEREAEEFLKNNGFEIVESYFFSHEKALDKFLKTNSIWPLVMKVSGKKIIHKKKIGGVAVGILDYGSAMKFFNELMEIENSEGVLVQRQIKGEEFFLGIKKTPEFGHVLGFGKGGSDVEKEGDVVFRVPPLDDSEIKNMINDSQIYKKMSEQEVEQISEILKKLCELILKYPLIKELDINPLISGKIIDARIVFEE